MLKSIWYLFKVLVVIGFTVFLAVQPGTVEFSWRDYTFRDLHLGAALVILFLTLLCVALLTGLLYRLFSLPREYMRVREENAVPKGIRRWSDR